MPKKYDSLLNKKMVLIHLRSMLTPLIVFLKIGLPKLTTPVEMVKAFTESDAPFDDVNFSSFLDEE